VVAANRRMPGDPADQTLILGRGFRNLTNPVLSAEHIAYRYPFAEIR
jgi:hypothetical protein